MNIKIIVAAHKPYRMPEDPVYLPLHVGRENKEGIGFMGDDTGDNISAKNGNYCELTGLYWAWKNLPDADAIGLAHYRRHFMHKKKGGKWDSVLTAGEAIELCGKYGVVVSNKRKYYIETIYSHYINSHNKEGIDAMIDVVEKHYPGHAAACNAVMNRNWAHMFNMFIMNREYFDGYCHWLFDVLFKIESRLDISDYSAEEARVFGYLSELLLNVWLEANSIRHCECKVMFMENQNWLAKGGRFLMRKLRINV